MLIAYSGETLTILSEQLWEFSKIWQLFFGHFYIRWLTVYNSNCTTSVVAMEEKIWTFDEFYFFEFFNWVCRTMMPSPEDFPEFVKARCKYRLVTYVPEGYDGKSKSKVTLYSIFALDCVFQINLSFCYLSFIRTLLGVLIFAVHLMLF